jgi:hypothetical protein
MSAIRPADSGERDPWTICTLTASGPIGALELFLQEAEGPGFLDWRADFMGLEGLPVATARRLRDVYERALLQAERDPYRCALDFNRLHPIPEEIRSAGYARAGRAWMIEQWGTPWPPPWVDHRMTLRRGRQTAVFIFPSFAGTPWPLLRHLTRARADLRFELDLDSTIQVGQGVAA